MKKRAFGLFAAVLMLLCLLPSVALADTITLTQDNIGDYMTIDGGSYQLGGDITITDGINLKGDVTIDLNGYKLERNGSGAALMVGYIYYDGTQHFFNANLTLKDSSESGTGKVTGGWSGISVNNTSSLTLESGTVSSSSNNFVAYAIAAGSGNTVTLKGGTVSAPNGAKAFNLTHADSSKSCATLNADGGTVDGPVNNEGGTITQSTGVPTATTFNGAVTNIRGTISGGTFNGTVTNEEYGTITGGTFNGAVTNIRGTISGGTFNGTVTNEEYGTITGGLFKIAPSGKETWNVTFKPENGEEDVVYKAVKGTTITQIDPPTKEGNNFVGWFAEDVGTLFDFENTAINSDITLYAKWVKAAEAAGSTNFHTVRATAGAGGSLSESIVSLRPGESFTFEFTPNAGYAVSDVRVDGESVGAVESYTFRNLKADHTLEVDFAPIGGAPATGTPADADKNPDTGANDVVGMAAALAAAAALAVCATRKKH